MQINKSQTHICDVQCINSFLNLEDSIIYNHIVHFKFCQVLAVFPVFLNI